MDNSSKVIEFLVSDQETGVRVDKALTFFDLSLSRSYIKKLILNGSLYINNDKIKDPSYKLLKGNSVKIIFPDLKDDKPLAQNIPLEIVYEDEYLIVLNKNAGMVVHPAPGNYEDTLVNALLFHCKDTLSGIGGVRRPGIVHRLDKDTSGLMVVAKDDETHRYLSKAISLKKIERRYKVLVWGEPKQKVGTINANIGRHPHDRKKMSVVNQGGRISITDYKLVKSYGFASLLECNLQTGRTHQIRVHLANMGLPVIGDKVYAKGKTVSEKMPNMLKSFSRQALHSYSLNLIHPRTKEELKFIKNFPADIQNLINTIEDFI